MSRWSIVKIAAVIKTNKSLCMGTTYIHSYTIINCIWCELFNTSIQWCNGEHKKKSANHTKQSHIYNDSTHSNREMMKVGYQTQRYILYIASVICLIGFYILHFICSVVLFELIANLYCWICNGKSAIATDKSTSPLLTVPIIIIILTTTTACKIYKDILLASYTKHSLVTLWIHCVYAILINTPVNAHEVKWIIATNAKLNAQHDANKWMHLWCTERARDRENERMREWERLWNVFAKNCTCKM